MKELRRGLGLADTAVAHPRVMVKRRPRTVVFIWFLAALFVSAPFVAGIILLPVWVETMTGVRQPGPLGYAAAAIFVPLLLAVTAFIAWVVARAVLGKTGRKYTSSDVYRLEGFEKMGIPHEWNIVERLYLNPSMEYMVLLYRGIEDPGRWAGDIIFKKQVVPSADALVVLIRSAGIEVDEVRRFSARDLMKLQTEREKAISSAT